MKELVIGRMPVSLGCQVLDAATRKGRVHLRLQAADGGEEEVVGDHVIAATGFKIDLRRLPFLGDALVRRISTVAGAPALSAAFETSVPGLHFAGVTAANTFGPLMRFMLGANYTARRLTRHLGPSARRRPMTDGVVSVGPARA
jgi:hypothetical protein